MVYKAAQLLSGHFQEINSGILLPTYLYILTLTFHTLSLFFIVKFHVQVHLIYLAAFGSGMLCCATYEFLTFPLFAKIYTVSERFRGRPLQGENKALRAERKALPSLKVWVGSSFYMQRHTVLTFVSLVLTMTANLLVSTKSTH